MFKTENELPVSPAMNAPTRVASKGPASSWTNWPALEMVTFLAVGILERNACSPHLVIGPGSVKATRDGLGIVRTNHIFSILRKYRPLLLHWLTAIKAAVSQFQCSPDEREIWISTPFQGVNQDRSRLDPQVSELASGLSANWRHKFLNRRVSGWSNVDANQLP